MQTVEQLITSVHNPHIRLLQKLWEKASSRREQGLFPVEGQRETLRAHQAGWHIHTLYACPQIADPQALQTLQSAASQTIHVSPQLYARIARRTTTEGIIATIRQQTTTLQTLSLPPSPLLVILESIEKPGNIGAILRTANAAGATAVILCDPLTDPYNPHLVRNSLGAIFTTPLIVTTTPQCIQWLQDHNIQILTAQLQDAQPYTHTPMTQPTAIVMGTESTGLTQPWRQAAHHHIIIPMQGTVDSLNVSVSTAIILYEALRQRTQKQQEQ